MPESEMSASSWSITYEWRRQRYRTPQFAWTNSGPPGRLNHRPDGSGARGPESEQAGSAADGPRRAADPETVLRRQLQSAGGAWLGTAGDRSRLSVKKEFPIDS